MSTELDIPKDVLLRCHQGDRQAFRLLVEQLKRPAYYHALALLGHPEDAMDVSQEAFVKAWQSIAVFDVSQRFYPWYYTILKRLALNRIRSGKRRPESSLDALPALADVELAEDDSTLSLEQLQINEQTRRLVQKALQLLSSGDREIICLKDMHDYAYRDIAIMLSIPEGTVMSRLYTARNRLRSTLADMGYE